METQISILAGLPPRSEILPGENVIVGRAAEVDLILSHPEVSRRHCRILWDRESWFVEDLGSQRGTAVNGSRISGRTALKPGDQIQVGPVLLVFGVTTEESSATSELVNPIGSVLYKGTPAETISLGSDLIFGRAGEVDVLLSDPVVSRRHAMIESGPKGYRLLDLHSKSGSFVNGRRFDEHDLVIGDQIQLGPFFFIYDGKQLIRVRRLSVGRIIAIALTKQGDTGPILNRAGFVAEPGQFIGILGPSGAGKTTLLNALSGLRPAESGKVLFDQTDLYKNLGQLRSLFGYVPQDDIVHSDLTVTEALTFAARLRLPAGTPRMEIVKLVDHTIASLGLSDRVNLKTGRLSGGQRKRVSVGVELLSRPPLLFLDEPTSGLDPLAEFKLMELLRRLADTGCTVVCTTHVMENVYLMDQIAIISEGRVVFQGPPDEARSRFGVARLSALYDALQAIDPKNLPPFEPALPSEPEHERPAPVPLAKKKRAFSLPILLARQLAIFRADIKNLMILLAQPIIIGALVAWVASDPQLDQFFAYIATLWFGCSNSAQEIVRELPIYRRERLVGLSRSSYLLSKFLWMGGLTAIQSLLLYATIAIGRLGIHGAAHWQVIGLVLLSFAATGIGLTVSAFARTSMQAVMLVPLLLIPQILFSGFTVPAKDMSPPVLMLSQIMPSFASERIADVSFFVDRKITGDLTLKYSTAYFNLNDWYRSRTGERIKTGTVYTETRPLWIAYLSLTLWIFAGFTGSCWLLGRKEHE
ncbi:MAG: FHA domain-containing protein [Verrucomicrobia bacterium]|nr:FHA domain-containing protein [Verrucomicrobiota bacterium]